MSDTAWDLPTAEQLREVFKGTDSSLYRGSVAFMRMGAELMIFLKVRSSHHVLISDIQGLDDKQMTRDTSGLLGTTFTRDQGRTGLEKSQK